jgi:hypothetical protein
VLIDDLVNVFVVNVAVPYRLRVNHHDRAFLATVQASGLIYPDPVTAMESRFLHAFFCIIAALYSSIIGTAPFTTIAFVDTKKDVPLVIPGGQLVRFLLEIGINCIKPVDYITAECRRSLNK